MPNNRVQPQWRPPNTTTLGSCSTAVCNPTISTSTNRISSSGYTFDANGSVTANAAGERFGYDAENHQTTFFTSSNSGSTADATYYYDGEGKRVKKMSSTETTIFVYDGGGQLVAEYSTAFAATQQVSYLTTDHLGSPRGITNENGAVTNRKDFMAFGDQASSAQRVSGSSSNGYDPASTREDYTGYEKDPESGLEFAQARYYNPTHGRYTSIDSLAASATIKNPQTFNRYSYVVNSPYKFIDPLGLLSQSTGACGNISPDGGGGGFGIGLTTGMGGFKQETKLPERPRLYIFVSDTTEGMSVMSKGKTVVPGPDFSSLIDLGKKNGVDVIITDVSTNWARESTSTNAFVSALRDPLAIGVLTVGHGVGNYHESDNLWHANGVALGGYYNDSSSMPKYSSDNAVPVASLDAKTPFIGLFGCDTKSAANLFSNPGSQGAIVAVDSGSDNLTALSSVGAAGYAAAKSLIMNRSSDSAFGAASTAFTKSEQMKSKRIGHTIYNIKNDNSNGDKLVRMQ